MSAPVLGLGLWVLLTADPLREAKSALDNREFSKADVLLAARLIESPDDAETMWLLARSARRAGDSVRGTSRLRAYAEKHGLDERFQFEARLLKVQTADAEEAARLFSEYSLKADDPDSAWAMEAYIEGVLRSVSSKGINGASPETDSTAVKAAAEREPDLNRAIDIWLKQRTGRADQVQGRIWRSRASFAANKHAAGVAALREALTYDPDHREARFQLALAVSMDVPDEARRHLERLLTDRPDDSSVRFGLANTYRMLGRGPDARTLYEGMLDGPIRTESFVELGTLDLEEGKLESAERRLQAALAASPNSPAVHIALSRLCQISGRSEEADRYRKRFDELEASSAALRK